MTPIYIVLNLSFWLLGIFSLKFKLNVNVEKNACLIPKTSLAYLIQHICHWTQSFSFQIVIYSWFKLMGGLHFVFKPVSYTLQGCIFFQTIPYLFLFIKLLLYLVRFQCKWFSLITPYNSSFTFLWSSTTSVYHWWPATPFFLERLFGHF